MPRTSVIIPAYNGATYLGEAIESVLRQRGSDLELIVVDDGSTDTTPQVLERYRGRIVSLYQDNSGMASARNRGIRASSGEFVAFVDSDDYWLGGKLAAQLALFEGHPDVGLVYSDTWFLQGTGYLPYTFFAVCPPQRGRVFDRLLLGSFIPMPTVVVLRRCLEEVGLFDERFRISADYALWLRVAARYKVDYVPAPLAVYRRHEGNTSKDAEAAVSEAIRITDECLSDPMMPRVEAGLARGRRAALQWQLGVSFLQNGRRQAARRAFLDAARLNPRSALPYLGYLLALTFGDRGLDTLRGVRRRVRAGCSPRHTGCSPT